MNPRNNGMYHQQPLRFAARAPWTPLATHTWTGNVPQFDGGPNQIRNNVNDPSSSVQPEDTPLNDTITAEYNQLKQMVDDFLCPGGESELLKWNLVPPSAWDSIYVTVENEFKTITVRLQKFQQFLDRTGIELGASELISVNLNYYKTQVSSLAFRMIKNSLIPLEVTVQGEPVSVLLRNTHTISATVHVLDGAAILLKLIHPTADWSGIYLGLINRKEAQTLGAGTQNGGNDPTITTGNDPSFFHENVTKWVDYADTERGSKALTEGRESRAKQMKIENMVEDNSNGYVVKYSNLVVSTSDRTSKVTSIKYGLFFFFDVVIPSPNPSEASVWHRVFGCSKPFVCITNDNQRPEAEGTMFWPNNFSFGTQSGGTVVPFMGLESVPLSLVSDALANYFKVEAGLERSLSWLNRRAIENRVMRGVSLTNGRETLMTENQLLTSKVEGCCSFWAWFYGTIKLFQATTISLEKQLKDLWNKGFMIGFIDGSVSDEVLLSSLNGTFLIRFSESTVGAITVSKVREKDSKKEIKNHRFNMKKMKGQSVANLLQPKKHKFTSILFEKENSHLGPELFQTKDSSDILFKTDAAVSKKVTQSEPGSSKAIYA